MSSQKLTMAAAVVVGLLFVAVAVVYFTQSADALPSFLPGHEAGVTGRHTKHGVVALALAVVCFVAAWFSSGPKTTTQGL